MPARLSAAALAVLFTLFASAQEPEGIAGSSRPLDSAALSRAQKKFVHAFEITRRFETDARARGFENDRWRQDVLAALMRLDETRFARIEGTSSLELAMSRLTQAGQGQASTEAQAKSLGTATSDLIYIPIIPCRILDTRLGNPVPARQTVSYLYSSNLVGSGNCNVRNDFPGALSGSPPAEAVNVTVDETSLTGFAVGSFLAIFEQGGVQGASFMNFGPGQVIANAGVIPINPSNGEFSVRTNAPANLIVDVYGVFVPPQATPLECIDTDKVTANVVQTASVTVTGASCSVGYTAVGGGCFGGASVSRSIVEATLNANSQWICHFLNRTDSQSFEAASSTRCCRVPGR